MSLAMPSGGLRMGLLAPQAKKRGYKLFSTGSKPAIYLKMGYPASL